MALMMLFQSTSPVRGTTRTFSYVARYVLISIHVPREGDDSKSPAPPGCGTNFNPRPP